MDYADQRFYASTYGRFLTPDPYVAGGAKKGNVNNPGDPGTWNRYAYVGGDPVNRSDPRGTDWCDDQGNCYQGSYPGAPSCGGVYQTAAFAFNTDYDYSLLDNPTFAAQAAAMGCYGASVIPVAAPVAPTPTCSIALYERPVGSTGAVHTYIDATITYNGVTAQDIIDGGPKGLFLYGWSTPGIVGTAGHYPTDNPSLPSNQEIGSPYTGPNACQDVGQFNSEVSSYDNGSLALYNPVPGLPVVVAGQFFLLPGYNSNSFTYTLLNSVGLASTFGSSSSWTPGWGFSVPGLTQP